MAIAPDEASGENTRITLGLLDSVERGNAQSQRRLAAELGIALGLVNAYLKRCIKKGLVKVNEAPARRYAYYLTPQGFAEKSRLTVEYLSHSFGFFRQAKSDCSQVLGSAADKGFQRVVLAGTSDLAGIAAICALDHGVAIVAVVDAAAGGSRFAGLAVYPSYDEVPTSFDAVLITDLMTARETTQAAIARYGAERVLIPALLRVRIGEMNRAVAL